MNITGVAMRLSRQLCVLALAVVTQAAVGQTHKFTPPPIPPNVMPAIPPCTVQPVPLNIDRINSGQGVRSVVSDDRRLSATVLFENGDVLKVLSFGCYTRSIRAQLWTGQISFIDKEVLGKAKIITCLVLDASMAKEIEQSMDEQTFDSKFERIRHIDTKNYLLLVTNMPLGGVDAFLKIDYLDNSSLGNKRQ